MSEAKELTKKQLQELREVAKYGMRDEDIANLFGISEQDLTNKYFKDLYQGKIEGRKEMQKIAFDLAKSGKFPNFTKFWLQAQDKWVEKHSIAIENANAANMQDEEEFDFTQLAPDELKVYERLREKAKKVRISINSGSESDLFAKGIH